MKRYLYGLDVWNTTKTDTIPLRGMPVMPRVLAEKTAKRLNRLQKNRRCRTEIFKTSKAYFICKDGTPHGYLDYFDFKTKEEN